MDETFQSFTRSVQTGKCEFCDSSYDPRPILEHLLDVHGFDKNGQRVAAPKGKGAAGGDAVGGSVNVRAHTRKRPT
jgi:hypothetical protein